MKAIVNTGPGRLEWMDWPTPTPAAGEVLIRTGAVGICATDIEMIAGWDRTGFPSIPGHEWAGTIISTGAGVDPQLAGRRCVAENVLSDGGEVGFEHPGGYGQFFTTEASRVQTLPDDFPFEQAALIEPVAVCVRALRRLSPACCFKEPVLLLGDGAIGLILLALLIHHGVHDVTLVGGRERRLRLAADIGADAAINYHTIHGDLATGLAAATRADFRTIIEASGSARALQASLQLAAPQADIAIVGDYGSSRADFTWNHLLHRELRLVGSNASAEAWPEAVQLVVGEHIPLDKMITHRFPAEQFRVGFDLVQRHDPDVIKVVLCWT